MSMARFRLTAPHCLNTSRGPALYCAGDEIDSADFVNFSATVQMAPLDNAAKQMIDAESNRILREHAKTIVGGGGGEVPGVGSVQLLPTYKPPTSRRKGVRNAG